MSKSKQNRPKLIKSLQALGVSESEYKNLGTIGEMAALLKQKQAEKVLQDAVTSPGDIDTGEPETDTGEAEADAKEPKTDTGNRESDVSASADSDSNPVVADREEGESEVIDAAPDSDLDPDPDPDLDLDLDLDPHPGQALLSLRALCGFEVKVIDVAEINERRLGRGETLKVEAGKDFQAGCETCEHLTSYRVAERV